MELVDLARLIENAARETPIGTMLDHVEVEPDEDDAGQNIVRVKLFVRFPGRNVDEDLEAVLEKIEDTVAAADDRYASVRFLDAA